MQTIYHWHELKLESRPILLAFICSAGMCRPKSSFTFPNTGWPIKSQKRHFTTSLHCSTSHSQHSRSWEMDLSFGFSQRNCRERDCVCVCWKFSHKNYCSLPIFLANRAKSLRTGSNFLIVNLAICDFVMMAKTPIFIYNSFNRGFALGNLGCQIFGVMGTVSEEICRGKKEEIWNTLGSPRQRFSSHLTTFFFPRETFFSSLVLC